MTFGLVNDAGGRFQIVNNGGVYQLAVAENLLIDHRPDGDGNHAYTIQVAATDAGGVSMLQTLTVTATGVAETRILGNANANTLNGTAGNDYIDGGANKDTMSGGAGNDAYIVDDGGDQVNEAAGGGNDVIYTSLTSADLNKYANVESLVYTGTANFTGKAGNGASTIIGGSGNDNLQGGNGNDRLEGLAGNDTIQGGGGADTIIGGAGNDKLTGDAGGDTFVFRTGFGNDVITDFNAVAGANHDLIELSLAQFHDFDAVRAVAQQVGQDVVITISPADTITLQKVAIANLDASDFTFL